MGGKAYIEFRTDAKPLTTVKWQDAERKLAAFFRGRNLDEVTARDAQAYRTHLKSVAGLAENSIRRQIGIARQFFKAAIEAGLIDKNPFVGQSAAVQANSSRFYFVTPEEAQAVLDACPNVRWRLIFSLCRFGGLRCPSEVLALRWSDVDFKGKAITVRSAKTEHHVGGDRRTIPMFRELEVALRDARREAKPGAELCVEYRGNSKNLRSQFQRILIGAGLEAWPKLFQNLRSTRETELLRMTGNIKAVASWLGHSPEVAMKHYAQVTEADTREALEVSILEGPQEGPAQKAIQKPIHNPIHTLAESTRTRLQARIADLRKGLQIKAGSEMMPSLATRRDNNLVGAPGLEPGTNGLKGRCSTN